MENNIVTQRFLECLEELIRGHRVANPRQFALSLDYLPQSLNEVQKKRRNVPIEVLQKAIELYFLNPVYLYTGKGPKFLREIEGDDFKILTIVSSEDNNEKIVHVPFAAQAGYATQLAQPEFIKDLPTFSLPEFKSIGEGTFRSFDVSGNSMIPTLHPSDKIVCSYLHPFHWETHLKNDSLYVIIGQGDVVVKRITNKIRAEKILLLHSDNEDYLSYEMPIQEIREIWAVKLKISSFLDNPRDQKSGLDDLQELKSTISRQQKWIEQLMEQLPQNN